MPGKRLAFGMLLALYFLCVAWLGASGPIGRAGYPFITVFVAASGLVVLAWMCWPGGRRGVVILILAAIAARACMLPFPVGDDIHRYVWEGKIQHAGYNPFRYAPADPELAHLRDANWEGINHKEQSAIYPPGSQLLFRLVTSVSEDVLTYKVVFALLDLVIVLILLRLASLFGMERRHVTLYALNPLVLVYFAGEGHLDPLYVCLFWSALLAWKKGLPALMWLALGAAVTAKFIPVVFAPLLIGRRTWKTMPLVFVPALAALPYLEPGVDLLAVFFTFLERFCYNGLLYSLFMFITPHGTVASMYCWISFCLFAGAVFLFVPDAFRACYLAAGGLLMCSPCVHQWYFLLIAPFLPFFRSPAWLLLLVTVSASFTTRFHQYATGEWIDYGLARLIEYVPFTVLGLWLFLRGRRTGPRTFDAQESVSVVIPALNEAGRIADSIRSVQDQDLPGTEIIVDDCAAGVRRARNDVVLVLYAGARLRPGALRAMLGRLAAEPQAVGGSFTVAHAARPLRYRLIALVDTLRAVWTGVSFGSQGQFFRRCALEGDLLELDCMEDVELAYRMKERGALITIPRGILPAERRGAGLVRKAFTAVRLTAFILMRRFGLRCRFRPSFPASRNVR